MIMYSMSICTFFGRIHRIHRTQTVQNFLTDMKDPVYEIHKRV